MTSPAYLKAMRANLTALRAILLAVLQDVDHGAHAAGQGDQNGAAGSIIPAEERLRQASILVQTILILHRQN